MTIGRHAGTLMVGAFALALTANATALAQPTQAFPPHAFPPHAAALDWRSVNWNAIVAERVEFPSADGRTMLVGYLFRPTMTPGERRPAVVMMHGRAGAYSSAARGRYDASTLSKRHKFWGALWASQGYVALMVDGFGPRGYPAGFPRFSYKSRPAELDEVRIRPLDAYGALAFLRTRPDVLGERVGLQGWSNGGSTVLAAMAPDAPGLVAPGFRAALSFYPGCGLKNAFRDGAYVSYAPLRVLMGTADEEVSPQRCDRLLRGAAGDVRTRFYPNAEHAFDGPERARQDNPANAAAFADSLTQSLQFFALALRP